MQTTMQLRSVRLAASQQRPSASMRSVAAPRRPHAAQRAQLGRGQAPQLRRLPAALVRALPQERYDSEKNEYVVNSEDIDAIAAEAREALQGSSVYLVGMMGSGKSTVGKLVGTALGYCAFDTDSLIVQMAGGRSVSQIFEEDGEAAFRGMETRVLQELSPYRDCVVSTGGGAVTLAANWGQMQSGIVVWLSGSPELLAARVLADGAESRPLLQQGGADDAHAATVARLSALLEERRQQYEFSDITIPLEGEGPGADLGAPAIVVACRVMRSIVERIEADAAMRKERMNFEIVKEEGLPSTMEVRPPVPMQGGGGAGGGEESDPFLP